MKITKIALKNFRAFHGEHSIDLGKKGRNLLVYGENGSGKSSLLKAIELFIDSHVRDLSFRDYRNFFARDTDGGYVKITMRKDKRSPETIYEWSDSVRETDSSTIINASKIRGSLDYRSLLALYFVHYDKEEVNLFDILINTILSNSINPMSSMILRDEWFSINDENALPKSRKHINKIAEFNEVLENFNTGLFNLLGQLETEASAILAEFAYPIVLKFDFRGLALDMDERRCTGNSIALKVEFFDKVCQSPQRFLNEAKLSAIALSIYFAALKIIPTDKLKLLVLDDVLVGLDMSNRLPVVEILKKHFDDYQIFLMTYDKEWYEILKNHFGNWKQIELYAGRGLDYEVPVMAESKKYLEKARFYLDNHDHKAAAVYLRTAFEVRIQQFCEEKNIPVKYRSKAKHLTTNDFWNPIKKAKNSNGTPYVERRLIFTVEQYRNLIMNPLSHAQLAIAPKQEIKCAIDTIERLKAVLDDIVKERR